MIRSAPRAISLLIADVLAQDRARVAGRAALALTAALVEGFGILSLVPVAALAVSPDAMDRVPMVGMALATSRGDRSGRGTADAATARSAERGLKRPQLG